MKRVLQSHCLMEQRIYCFRFLPLLLFLSFSSLCAECRIPKHLKNLRGRDGYNVVKHLDYSFPPSEDVLLGPFSSPQTFPPFCVFPPPLPITPILPIVSPPPPPPPPTITIPPFITPNPPECYPSPLEYNPITPVCSPSPPEYYPGPPLFVPGTPVVLPGPPGLEPSPPGIVPSPPEKYPSTPGFEPGTPIVLPGPPGFEPSPPEYYPGPPEFVPGPPIFLPPVVYPPPNAPPPPRGTTGQGLWCVAKPTVPDPIVQEAMNYACGSGADCGAIQPDGLCYKPDTLIAHASFAFNSYWQRTKAAGGTCDFGGTAMLVTRDPSYDGCHFLISGKF